MPFNICITWLYTKAFPSAFSLVFKMGITFGCRDKLVIAPYGFDKSTWDPSTDYFLPKKFNAENMSGKAVCKVALLQRLGLSEHSSITVVSVPLFVSYKP